MTVPSPDAERGPKPGTLEHVEEAIRAWYDESVGDDGDLLSGFVVVFGETSYADDGDPLYRVNYTCGPGVDLARAMGLLVLGKQLLMEDATPDRDE